MQLFPSGTQAAQQVVSGQIDVGLVTPEPVAIGQARNTDLTYFAQYWTRWIYTLKIPQDSPITSVAASRTSASASPPWPAPAGRSPARR